MPYHQDLSAEFADFTATLDDAEIEQLVANPQLRRLQTAEPVTDDALWDRLDSTFFDRRPDVELRVYGFYGMTCDLGFAVRMRRVRRFAADCLMSANRVEAIAEMPSLEALSLGVYDIESFEGVLDRMRPGLRKLTLGRTKSKRPDLGPLARFRELQVLYVEGHRKNIEVLSTLHALEDLTLRSVTVPDLGFLGRLERLWSLDLKLGGTHELQGIAGHPAIEYLELWQIKGLSDVGIVGQLPALQSLHLESLRGLRQLPDLRQARKLRHVHLQNLKGLRDLTPLATAPVLEEVAIIDNSHLQPEDVLPVLGSRSLRRLSASLGSNKKDARLRALRGEHGIAEFNWWQPSRSR